MINNLGVNTDGLYNLLVLTFNVNNHYDVASYDPMG